MSRFVVQIPFWVYLIGLATVISVSMYAIALGVILGLIYFLIVAPKQTLIVIAVLLAIKYWKISLPIIGVFFLIEYVMNKKSGGKHSIPLLEKF